MTWQLQDPTTKKQDVEHAESSRNFKLSWRGRILDSFDGGTPASLALVLRVSGFPHQDDLRIGIAFRQAPHAFKNDAILQNDAVFPTGSPKSHDAPVNDLPPLLPAQFDNCVRFRSSGQEQHGLFGNNDSRRYE